MELFFTSFHKKLLQEIPAVVWEKSFGGQLQDNVHCSIVNQDNQYLFLGDTESKGIGEKDAWLFQTDSLGELLWDKTIGGSAEDVLLDMVETQDGGYLLFGYTQSKGYGKEDMWLVKTNTLGNVEWNKALGSVNVEKGQVIRRTNDDYYLLAGSIDESADPDRDTKLPAYFLWLMKVDVNGKVFWENKIITDELVTVTDAFQTYDDGFLVTAAGSFNDSEIENPFLLRVDAEGKVVSKNWLGFEDEYRSIRALAPLWDGTIIFAGTISDAKGNKDGWLVRSNIDGIFVWEKTLGGKGNDEIYDIIRTSDGGLIFSGTSEGGNGNKGNQMWLVKTSLKGQLLWEKHLGNREKAYAVLETLDDDIIVVGSSKLEKNFLNLNRRSVDRSGDVRIIKLSYDRED